MQSLYNRRALNIRENYDFSPYHPGTTPSGCPATPARRARPEYEPGIFEVKFNDAKGHAYALEILQESQLMLLHHEPLEGRKLASV